MKPVTFHKTALAFIRSQSSTIKKAFGEALRDIQKGLPLKMPLSKPMPSIYPGAYELRDGDEMKAVRVFYFVKYQDAILVFHAFEKRTQKTPQHESEMGRKKLKELLDGKK